jgi:hypothetical protein
VPPEALLDLGSVAGKGRHLVLPSARGRLLGIASARGRVTEEAELSEDLKNKQDFEKMAGFRFLL